MITSGRRSTSAHSAPGTQTPASRPSLSNDISLPSVNSIEVPGPGGVIGRAATGPTSTPSTTATSRTDCQPAPNTPDLAVGAVGWPAHTRSTASGASVSATGTSTATWMGASCGSTTPLRQWPTEHSSVSVRPSPSAPCTHSAGGRSASVVGAAARELAGREAVAASSESTAVVPPSPVQALATIAATSTPAALRRNDPERARLTQREPTRSPWQPLGNECDLVGRGADPLARPARQPRRRITSTLVPGDEFLRMWGCDEPCRFPDDARDGRSHGARPPVHAHHRLGPLRVTAAGVELPTVDGILDCQLWMTACEGRPERDVRSLAPQAQGSESIGKGAGPDRAAGSGQFGRRQAGRPGRVRTQNRLLGPATGSTTCNEGAS